MTATSRSTRSARTVMSSRLPIGVATTKSVPGMCGERLLYHCRICGGGFSGDCRAAARSLLSRPAGRSARAAAPGIFVKVGIEAMRGTLKFIDEDLPRAFAGVDDLHLLGDLADAQAEASQAVGKYIEYLDTDLAPKARASFRLGRDKFEQK